MGKFGDRAAAKVMVTMHQAVLPITVFGHRINNGWKMAQLTVANVDAELSELDIVPWKTAELLLLIRV